MANVRFLLSELDLQSCLQLGDKALVHIGELSQLKRLNLYSCSISATVLNVLGRYVVCEISCVDLNMLYCI